MRTLVALLRGFRGHPSHPPLTDATIGAFTIGTLLAVVAWFGWVAQQKLAVGALLAIVGGLVFSIPTILTGYLDLLRITRGTGMRRMATTHWVAMTLAVALYLVAAALLQEGFDHGRVSGFGVAVAVVALGLLAIGGWLGGSLVFEYGMRVQNQDPLTPFRRTVRPNWPPD